MIGLDFDIKLVSGSFMEQPLCDLKSVCVFIHLIIHLANGVLTYVSLRNLVYFICLQALNLCL